MILSCFGGAGENGGNVDTFFEQQNSQPAAKYCININILSDQCKSISKLNLALFREATIKLVLGIVFLINSLDFQMEITNDIQFLLPIMVAIMIAKWVGDFATHPLYHALLELKCIPFLDSEPVILHEGSQA